MKSIFTSLTLFITFLAAAQTADFAWARSAAGNAGGAVSYAICNDNSGNVYITGTFQATSVTFGSTTLTNVDPSGGTQEVFVVKYDPNGNVLWAKSGGGLSEDEGKGIATDGDGNVYVTGYTLSRFISFGHDTFTNPGTEAPFVVKYDSSGNVQWVVGANGDGNLAGGANAIAVDANGDAAITGSFTSSIIIFGSDTLTNAGAHPSDDAFVARYNSSGSVVWAQSIGGTGYESGTGAGVDGSGNTYVTGTFTSATATAGTKSVTNSGQGNIYVVKLDSEGSAVWANSAGGSGSDLSVALTTDVNGNSYITGDFTSSQAIFGSARLLNGASAGTKNFFIAKYGTDGGTDWAVTPGGGGQNAGYSISIDRYGDVYATGIFENYYMAVGKDTVYNIELLGEQNLFVAKYDTAGHGLFGIDIGNVNDQSEINYVSTDNHYNVYVTGGFYGTIVLGGDSLKCTTDVFPGSVYTAKVKSSLTGINNPSVQISPAIVFPNPTTGQVYFKNVQPASTLQVFDIMGQSIYSSKIQDDTYSINLAEHAKGIYLYRIMSGDGNVQEGKMIVE